MNEQIMLVEIDGYNKATGLEETLRFCDGLAYRLRPTETPANALYRPFVLDPGWCRVDVFSKPGQYSHVTPGEVILQDMSGSLGAQLINYAFDGRRIVMRIGDRGAAYPVGFVTVINGTLDGQPTFNWDRIIFRPADLTAAMRKPLQTERYAGDNVLPNGVEGVDDLKGRVKPIVLALASNMTPQLVNTSKLIYHVSIPVGTAAVSVSAGRDKGVPLVAGAAYVSIADMLTNAPAAGQYRVLSNAVDGCYVRLGSSPAGAFTLDAAYGTATDRTHAQVWRRILLYAGVAPEAISDADVAALDAALPAEIEFAVFDETTVDAVLTDVATSAGSGWIGDELGIYRITQWSAPAGTPVATLSTPRMDSMGIADPVGNGDVAPAYLVTVQWGRNWTVQPDSALGGDKTSVSDPVRAPGGRAGIAARAWLAVETRTVTARDLSVQTAHKNAVELALTSLIADQAAAQSFANAQLALYGVDRHMTQLSQWLSPAQIDVIRPGVVVTVKETRWAYDAGRMMRVAGVKIDRGTGKTELNCWG
ncbi:hypothetical protein [Herbaspirillum sp. ST 5-3]|uniref:hypothetical protein n=1 Tax=Oxalobacteraceae TaxID=75682 RepID=UPI0010A4C451|nr:hypothetical protein [Herbaspirillum sp. ST 5-3]